MSEQKKASRIWEFLLIFALVYLLSETVIRFFGPAQAPQKQQGGVILEPLSASFRIGHHPVLTVRNSTDQPLTLPDRCPMPPLHVFRVTGTGTGASLTPMTTTETAVPCAGAPTVPAGSEVQLSLAPWKYSLFGEAGTYEAQLPLEGGAIVTSNQQPATSNVASARFSVHKPGVIVKSFRTFITKPFLNFLVLVASVLPDHNLGIAIIVLTLLVKLILYFPSQHAMEGQRKMQLLQPRVQELQKRFKGDPKKLHEETLKLWRQEKVNPFQSCLPIVLQFPILIGLFFVIRDGSDLALSREFLYPVYEDLPWNFSTAFLGLTLTRPSYVFPPLLVALQYLQMKLAFHAQQRKKPFDSAQGKQVQPVDRAQRLQQTMMLYTLPLMIGFFALQFPDAVSLYWAVSTVFAIGQQLVANRKVG